MTKKSNINIEIGLDKDNIPESIHWTSEDNPSQTGSTECKAILLSLFDKNHLDTFKIDLWTKEMHVAEMDRFMFQTLKSLAGTYFKATHNEPLSNAFQSFVHYFGEQTEIIPKESADETK
jgi:gliding motility-associated protein GldC